MKLGCVNIDLSLAISFVGLAISIMDLVKQDPAKARMRQLRRLEKGAYQYYYRKSGTRLTKQERCSDAELYEACQFRSAKEAETYLQNRGRPGGYVRHLVYSCIAEGEISEEHRFGRCHLAAAFFRPLALGEISLYNKTSYA